MCPSWGVNYAPSNITPQGTSILSTLCKSYARIAFTFPFLLSSVSYLVAKQPRLLQCRIHIASVKMLMLFGEIICLYCGYSKENINRVSGQNAGFLLLKTVALQSLTVRTKYQQLNILKNKKPTRYHLLFLFFFLDTQHVSGINMPIFRSLRLCC